MTKSYLSFGFTWTDFEDYLDILWMIYQKLLESSFLVCAQMGRHFENYHPTLVGKTSRFWGQTLRNKRHVETYSFNNDFNQNTMGSVLFHKQKNPISNSTASRRIEKIT